MIVIYAIEYSWKWVLFNHMSLAAVVLHFHHNESTVSASPALLQFLLLIIAAHYAVQHAPEDDGHAQPLAHQEVQHHSLQGLEDIRVPPHDK